MSRLKAFTEGDIASLAFSFSPFSLRFFLSLSHTIVWILSLSLSIPFSGALSKGREHLTALEDKLNGQPERSINKGRKIGKDQNHLGNGVQKVKVVFCSKSVCNSLVECK